MSEEAGLSGAIGVILMAVLVWAVFFRSSVDYSKPWFEGTEAQRVCSGETGSCYNLPTYSNGEQVVQVNFPNGGYLHGESECFEAADIHEYDRFCRFTDQDGNGWDIIPL